MTRFVRSAPLTFTWMAILLVTTVIQHQMGPRELEYFLSERSTNVANLARDPVRVIFESLLWLDGAYWLPYAIAFCVILAPAERWLGTLRMLTIGLLGHVVATYVSESMLAYRIRTDHPERSYLIDATDVGVSYFLATVLGVIIWRLRGWQRWGLAAILLGGYVFPLVVLGPNFTRLGHLVAVIVGMLLVGLVPTELRGQLTISSNRSVRKSSGDEVDGSAT